MPDFAQFSVWLNLAIVVVAGVGVWFSGVRLEAATEAIADQTGIGHAFGGLVLLAMATSLPEVATTITGATLGDAALVSNNLLGGIMLQTALLAVADFAFRRGALTYFAPQYSLLISGISLVLALGVTLVICTLGDREAWAGIGYGAILLLALHGGLLYVNYRARHARRWRVGEPGPDELAAPPQPEREPMGLRKAWIVFTLASLGILWSGWLVTLVAEALSRQTGLGSSFVGATLVALATSLPEVSTTLAAVRHGHNAMAVSNIFGSNLWCVVFLFLADAFYRSGPLLAVVPLQATFTAGMGLVMTCVYLWGLLERRNFTFARAGIDSWLVLLLYGTGLTVLYLLR